MQTHIMSLLKISDTSELPARFPRLTDEEIASFNCKEGNIVCTPDDFHMDFTRLWKKLSLNKLARKVIIVSFVKKAEGGKFPRDPPPAKFLNDEALGPIVDQYMKTLRRAYREAHNPKEVDDTVRLRQERARNSRMNTVCYMS